MNSKFNIKILSNAILKSYSQIFFSENLFFASILLIVSFIDVWAGISGIIAVLSANITAYILGYNRNLIQKGIYGFNALLVGLGSGLTFIPNIELFVIVIFISILVLFITIALQGILAKYALPFLSIPFLLGIWAVTLSTKDFLALGLSERGIYAYNEIYALGGNNFVKLYDWFNNIPRPESLKIYFLSLGAIFFQNNIFAGMLIAIGLLSYSRIAFSISLIGFYAAFMFYNFTGANFTELGYTFIGFNYILTSIAIGSYFLLPSIKSYLWTIILLPITVILTSALAKVFSIWDISIYSLPFNIVVMLFLYVLKLRITKREYLTDNFIKQENPEKTIYLNKTAIEVNKNNIFYPISLPFLGEWFVMQAHDGKYTHKKEWKHAWDFIIIDNKDKQYKNNGDYVEDYYCYDKSIIAPADGIVSDIFDGIDDNIIGEVNTIKNWGNSIVIKHTELLYTQISHIKSGSFKVKKGDFVKKGNIIAKVGNSGHSPYPHIHFQMQATPFIGSPTFDYPLHNYILKENKKVTLINFDKPKLNQRISNVMQDEILTNTFNFIPGQKLKVIYKKNNIEEETNWQVLKTAYNETYLYCENTESSAYYFSNETGFYFKNYYGDKSSPLFSFYKSIYSLNKTFHKDIQINSKIRPDLFFKKAILFLQDFISPFFLFLNINYTLNYIKKDDDFTAKFINLSSTINQYIFNKNINKINSEIIIKQDKSITIKIDKTSEYIQIKPLTYKNN